RRAGFGARLGAGAAAQLAAQLAGWIFFEKKAHGGLTFSRKWLICYSNGGERLFRAYKVGIV
ncbi:MAG: hypothetical protein FWG66_05010, partial [Spirochaetes bacterium]|nr:hypothetical protein [Spirochaetota bacterium]